MGVKILSQYSLLGPYDFVNLLDAPENEIIVKVAVELGSRGTLQTMTMPAITVDKPASLDVTSRTGFPRLWITSSGR